MLIGTNKPFMLCAVILNIVMISVIIPNVVKLTVIMLNVTVISVIMPNVVAPFVSLSLDTQAQS